MKRVELIPQRIQTLPKRTRVAAYVRVSKNTDRLNHSLSAQVSYYSRFIQERKDWEYVGVYSDSGESGLRIENRTAFQQVVEDGKAGKIDLILTKSISRFARNTVDLLETVRTLKEAGVDIFFEKENIHSISSEGEVMLSIFASLAQEESLSISQNVKWALQKRRESGIGGIRYGRVLGYESIGGNYRIVEDEAKIVREIFQQFLDGIGIRTIAKSLNSKGLRTVKGYTFTFSKIRYILTNELYTGNHLLQKYYVSDPLTKQVKKNKGELAQYYVEDTHPPIISQEIFELVQKEYERRNKLYHRTYPFTGKLICTECGEVYYRCARSVKNIHWGCRSNKFLRNRSCVSTKIQEVDLEDIVTRAMEWDTFDKAFVKNHIHQILVDGKGNLKIKLKNGEEVLWQK